MFSSKLIPKDYNEDEPPDGKEKKEILDLEVDLKVLGYNDFQEVLNVRL